MSKARYSIWGVRGGVVFVVDQFSTYQPTTTITNDAEAVTREVSSRYPDMRIVYRDTDGQWDELLHKDGTFQGFGSFLDWTPEDELYD